MHKFININEKYIDLEQKKLMESLEEKEFRLKNMQQYFISIEKGLQDQKLK